MEATKSPHGLSRLATRSLAIAAIAAWLALSAWAAGVLLMIAGLTVATFFAEPATGSEWIGALAFSGAGALAAAAGPFGVWLFHRRRGWLIAAGWAAAITALVAACILVSFSAE